MIFNALDRFVDRFIDPLSPRSSRDPTRVLAGNFFPVSGELPPTECHVVAGSLPPCLDGGVYLRNGPNPRFMSSGQWHLFDGDGMVHAVSVRGAHVTLCSRYVKTYKYEIEKEAGRPVLPGVFSGFNNPRAFVLLAAVAVCRVLTGKMDPRNGVGLANVSLAVLGRRLFALGEYDLPYALRLKNDGDVETAGRHDFGGKLVESITAHPKVDPDTGEAFAFRYSVVRPFLTLFRFDPDGKIKPDVPIFSVRRSCYVHDFAITKKYAIFVDAQLRLQTNPIELIFHGGSPVRFDKNEIPRLGILPRYARDDSEMRWFDVPGFNPLHVINAWDEDNGNAVVLVVPNLKPIELFIGRMDLVQSTMEKVRVDLTTGVVTRQPISVRNLEFGVINPSYVAKPSRYVYAAVVRSLPKVTGVVKLDLSRDVDCTVARRMYAQGCYGGEPFFVARQPENPEAEEDDGYLVTYVHDEMAGESKFVVMDAKSPELDVVAAVKLPRRVPYGFHGLFVREDDVNRLHYN